MTVYKREYCAYSAITNTRSVFDESKHILYYRHSNIHRGYENMKFDTWYAIKLMHGYLTTIGLDINHFVKSSI